MTMKLWIITLSLMGVACDVLQSKPALPSTIGSCDMLCSCEEKDGVFNINCEERGIKELSQVHVPPSRPFHLSLLNNSLTMLHVNDFSSFINALSLHLGFNYIVDIEPGAFNGLSLLKQLHINHNSLEVLKEDTFHGLENLEFLQADNNFITIIESSAFSKLNRLKVLILNDNAIEFLPSNVFRFVPLTHLDLRGNQLQTLPYVGFLEHIGRILDLQLEDNKWVCNCDLVELKAWLENMPPQSIIGDVVCHSPPILKGSILSRLKKESLCPTHPTNDLDAPSGSLPLVVTTSISDSHYSTKVIPIFRVPTRETALTLHVTKPATLLPGVYCPIPCQCTSNILSGILMQCQEQNIESLSDLGPPPPNPKKLILAGNIIQTLLKSDLVDYGSLDLLHLGSNRIEILEEGSFLNLTRLQKLYLNGNHLTKLSRNLFLGLQRLEYLYLEYNFIKEVLPGTFHPMPKLKVLYLNNNLLQTLPAHIFSGVPLARLNLKTNQFAHLPVGNVLDDLDLLVQLELEDNPWDCTCDSVGLQQWIQKLNRNTMTGDIFCTSPRHLAKKKLKSLNSDVLCPGINSPPSATHASFIVVTTSPTTTNTADTILRSLTDAIPLSVLILGLLVVFVTIIFCAAGIVVLVLHRRRRYKKKHTDEQMRDNSPVQLQYSMYGHKTTHHTTERPATSLYEQRMLSPMVQVYRSPSFSPKFTDHQQEMNDKEMNDSKHLRRGLLEREHASPLTGSNVKYKATDQSAEFLSFQDASSLYRNILEKERELQQLGITEYLRKNIAQLHPDMEVHYPGAHEELKLMETLMYSRPRKVLLEQTKNEYFELKANLHAEPDYLEVLEQQT
uniref:SLIT and NTRK like family member 6 n=1 Tax=Podarcis muralis TaxID=64176 RepID=A0A670I477_PODMU|nr:SLIT and NTRK-like protein 6 [Podarcis muralis]XP_028584119.1 SLIT and NTRK-like protein 6 [Podarcis muralis]XP_028584120.1 SLIT and NTRK-like protein 6 [Podarcis muralis]